MRLNYDILFWNLKKIPIKSQNNHRDLKKTDNQRLLQVENYRNIYPRDIMSGWVKMHRKMTKWGWYKKTNTKILFLHLLLKANHKKKTWQGIEVFPGELITGRKVLSFETGLSEQQIRTALTHLASTNDVTIKSTKKYSIITITNWDDYQSQQPATQPTTNQVVTTNKNVKNVKKKEFYQKSKISTNSQVQKVVMAVKSFGAQNALEAWGSLDSDVSKKLREKHTWSEICRMSESYVVHNITKALNSD